MEIVAPDSQTLYETAFWIVVLGISGVFLFYSYLLTRLAHIARRRVWKRAFYAAAVAFFGLGLWRVVVCIVYYDSYTAKLAFPATAAISWTAIALVSYAVTRWVEQASRRISSTVENVALMEAVQKEIVEPILRGEPVSQELVAEHKARSLAFTQGMK